MPFPPVLPPSCRHRLAQAGLIGLLLSSPAAAQPPWNVIAVAPSDSTSRCIGQPTTPRCAVETFLACFQRGDAALCRQVDAGYGQYAQIFDDPADPAKFLAYRVLDERQDGEDAVIVDIEQKEIAPGQTLDAVPASTSRFKTRRQSDATWHIEGWDDLTD